MKISYSFSSLQFIIGVVCNRAVAKIGGLRSYPRFRRPTACTRVLLFHTAFLTTDSQSIQSKRGRLARFFWDRSSTDCVRENTCECEARTVQLPDVKRPTCVHLGAPPWPRPRAAAYTCRPNQRGPSVPPPARSKRVRGGPTAAAEFVYGSVHLTGPHYPNLYKFAEKTSGTRRRRPIIRPQPQRTRDSQPATPRTQTQRSDRVDRPAERRFV